MARRLVGVHSFGVLTYQTRKAVADESSPTGARMETATCTATMPDIAVIPAQARGALKDSVGVSIAAGVVGFYVGSDDQPTLQMPEAPKPAKASK